MRFKSKYKRPLFPSKTVLYQGRKSFSPRRNKSQGRENSTLVPITLQSEVIILEWKICEAIQNSNSNAAVYDVIVTMSVFRYDYDALLYDSVQKIGFN
jgi:hypothetical protein